MVRSTVPHLGISLWGLSHSSLHRHNFTQCMTHSRCSLVLGESINLHLFLTSRAYKIQYMCLVLDMCHVVFLEAWDTWRTPDLLSLHSSRIIIQPFHISFCQNSIFHSFPHSFVPITKINMSLPCARYFSEGSPCTI